jgi:3-oxoadipate enol-lactonase
MRNAQANVHETKTVGARTPMAEAERELSVANDRLRFRDEGVGPAVLLIHGWTLDLDMWELQVRALRDSFRLIRYDRRGFGLSSGRPSLVHDITDVRALCEHLRLQSVALLGMSQGARVAAHIAAGNPTLVSCVIFDGAPAGIVSDGEAAENDIPITAYRALVRTGGTSEFLKEWRAHPLTQLRTRDGPTHELLKRILERYRAVDLQEPGTGEPPPPPPPRAASIRSPALIISGALDLESRIRAADALARALPGSERAIVPESGHLPSLDNPHVYNTLLRKFLERFASSSDRAS